MTKLLLETFNPDIKQKRTPFWFMRQAGRYLPEYREVRATTSSFLEFCYSPDKACEVTLQPLRRYNMDGAILFADILVVPDCLGQKVWFEAGHGPRLEPVDTAEKVSKLSLAGFHDKAAPVYETLRLLKKALPAHATLLGFAGAPWTVATYMVEGEGSRDHGAARSMGYANAGLFGSLLERLVVSTSEYLIKQIDAGADVVQIFDSWASALNTPCFDAWVIEPTAEIVRRVKAAHPNTPIIGFPRLAGTALERYVARTGVDGVSLDTGVDLSWAAKTFGRDIVLQGNMDPWLVVAGGAAMEQEATRILTEMADTRHIFNLGHGFVPQTPPEHVARLSEIIHAFEK